MKHILTKYGSAILVAAIVFVLGMSFGQTAFAPLRAPGNGTESSVPSQTVSLMIDYGNGVVVTDSVIPIQGTTTVFAVLKTMTDKKGIALVSKDFGGDLGVFIESIGGIGKDPAGQKWWQFWINNSYSQSGASNVIVRPGDSVEFKFIKGQE